MLSFTALIDQAEARFKAEIIAAGKAKAVDPARINRRRNETYFTRLSRAVLTLSQNYELVDPCYSLCVALPELMLAKMFFLGWGGARSQADTIKAAPSLLRDYSELFAEQGALHFEKLLDAVKSKSINYGLICHGLSATSDTLLLLCDIGRSSRISYALGIRESRVLLADVSWIKYNRSLTRLFDRKVFLDALRICLDKRKRLYVALGLDYRVFGVSDYGSEKATINKTELEHLAEEFRQLALTLWGEKSLEPHDKDMKKIIGAPLTGVRKSYRQAFSPQIATLLSYPAVASGIEKDLESELTILRTISELFSTFDRDIFVYYFAQYFAQTKYSKYFKVAPVSEKKFDLPFAKESRHFSRVAPKRKQKEAPSMIDTGRTDAEVNGAFEIYCPQYRLSRYEILPYTSTSGDILKETIPLDEFLNNTVLLDDSYHNKIDKVVGVFTETPTAQLNRIVSDLCSFVHLLFLRCPSTREHTPLHQALSNFDAQICEQVYSQEDTPDRYNAIYADWLKAIEHKDAVVPFHLIPYLWETNDWDKDRIQLLSRFVLEILSIVNEICE